MWGLSGITVILHERIAAGADPFGADIIADNSVNVDDVIVSPSTEAEIADTLNLYGRKAIYTLSIPKGDSHNWENGAVEFFGESWRVIGKPLEYIEGMVPLRWNRKVRVESIGNT